MSRCCDMFVYMASAATNRFIFADTWNDDEVEAVLTRILATTFKVMG